MPVARRLALLVAVGLPIVVLDQLVNAVVVQAIGPGAPTSRIELLGAWLALEYVENRGVAFGLLAGLGPLVAVVPLRVLLMLLALTMRAPHPPVWQVLGVGLVGGGAIGNLIDRLRFGYVIDFISVGIWPNFNVADSAVSIGAVCLIWGWIATSGQEPARDVQNSGGMHAGRAGES